MNAQTLLRAALAALAGAVTVAACSVVHSTTPLAAIPPVTVSPTVATLATLVDRDRDPVGYQRAAFGPAWVDADRNGCDTRNDVLARDLTAVTFKAGTHDCVVATGVLERDPYTGQRVVFTRGARSADVQIDHVVSLADAWRSGANTWAPELRSAYANNPAVLLAVAGPVNESKSDKAADEWHPSAPGAACAYATRVVSIKAVWHLSVTAPERAALEADLRSCS